MPNLHIPRRSSQHRIAAIALYRVLLAQCRAAPIAEVQRSQLQNIVRNRFKQAQHSASKRLLRVSFEAGYEAVDHLDAAIAGNSHSVAYLTTLWERAPAKVKLPKPASVKFRTTSKEQKLEEAQKYPMPSLFDRPLPLEKLSGKRHLPVLFNANGIPVLRIKKPQPENLSRYIRQRLVQRQELHDRRHRLYDEQNLAIREDEWDRILGRTGDMSVSGAMSESGREPPWQKAVGMAVFDVQGKLDEWKEKNRVMAEKMQAVVDRERELFEEEKFEGMKRKKQEKRQRREERRMSEGQEAEAEAENGHQQPTKTGAQG